VTGSTPLLECVPNVSEGKNRAVIKAIADAVRQIEGVRLADIHADPDHHRTVFTILGEPDAVETSVLALIEASLSRINMRRHQGVHPRIGAVDVVPLVPLKGMAMQEAVARAHRIGREAGERFKLPVYFYAEAALRPERRRLFDLRRGEYEGLRSRLADPEWQPDAGPSIFNARSGAMAVGARELLVAFNIWLRSKDLDVGKAIASVVRNELPALQAMAVRLDLRECIQISMNLTDYRRTSLKDAFEAVSREAARRGINIKQSELIGLTPREALGGADPRAIGLPVLPPSQLLGACRRNSLRA
jgi:glutamate formiminotransferase